MNNGLGRGPNGGSFGGVEYGGPAGGPGSYGVDGAGQDIPGGRPQVRYLDAVKDATKYAGRWACAFPAAQGSSWLIRRITIQCDAPTAVEAYVYTGLMTAANMVSNTDYGNLNENDCVNPILLEDGTALLVLWNTTAGTYAHARVEYLEV